jgi:hypothetical protein
VTRVFKRHKLDKRGTEKPIEIFVALFIILAVAMLLLKMMRDQTRSSQDELEKQKRKEAMEAYKTDAQNRCDDLCNDAKQNGCNVKDVARFCLEKYKGELSSVPIQGFDINGNNEIDAAAIDDVGVLICEDNVYCSQETTPKCPCKGGLDMKTCIKVLCDHFTELDPATAPAQVQSRIDFGECDVDAAATNKWIDYVTVELGCP